MQVFQSRLRAGGPFGDYSRAGESGKLDPTHVISIAPAKPGAAGYALGEGQIAATGTVTPIMESRVTSAASCSSPSASVPVGRIGKTR
jgi:hypothetical protein